MPELHEVIRVLAQAAAYSPGWSTADADLIVEWIEENRPLDPKPTPEATEGEA